MPAEPRVAAGQSVHRCIDHRLLLSESVTVLVRMEFAISAGGLEFDFWESLEFGRVGSVVTAAVLGECTSIVGSGQCDLQIAGIWVPELLMGVMTSASLESYVPRYVA